MTERSVTHSTFVIERTYDAPPARVFAAWASLEAKTQWFGSGLDSDNFREFDFRVGGREAWHGEVHGSTFSYDATYQDIVQDERIVYAYDMHMNDQRISVSLSTVEIEAVDGGTHLTYTEQGAFLDGLDEPDKRQEGTETLLDNLGKAVTGEHANA